MNYILLFLQLYLPFGFALLALALLFGLYSIFSEHDHVAHDEPL